MDALSTLAEAALATVVAATEGPETGLESAASQNALLPLKQERSADVGIILQSLCHLHRYVRTSSDLHIYEKPERLRSVRLGIAIAHGRLSDALRIGSSDHPTHTTAGSGAVSTIADKPIEDLLDSLTLGFATSLPFAEAVHIGAPFSITSTSRRLALANPVAAAIDFAHGDDYIAQLCSYMRDTAGKLAAHESEVPNTLSQGDLYLCDSSLQALEGALGACCHAIDEICAHGRANVRRFVSIRPPGHHCETGQPMGFCWLNNVAVAAAHAHLEHGINRIIIVDIDLHHGNGTQHIVWRLNALAHKRILDASRKSVSPRKGSPKKAAASIDSEANATSPLQLFYGSLHDIDSYPCEDLDPMLIAAASVNISGGGGGQYISNVHLQPYSSVEDFCERLYPQYIQSLLGPAKSFLQKTDAQSDQTLVIVSAGFDASEHEYATMSRHGAKVPTCFFEMFARDLTAFANEHARGKVCAILEGGYSQRALSTGVASFMTGFVDSSTMQQSTREWFDPYHLSRYENIASVSRSAKSYAAKNVKSNQTEEQYLQRIRAIYNSMEDASPDKDVVKPIAKNGSMTPSGSKDSLASASRTTRSKVAAASSPVKAESGINFGETSKPNSIVIKPTSPLMHSVDNTTGSAIPDSIIATPSPFSAVPVKPKPAIKFTFKAGDQQALLSHRVSPSAGSESETPEQECGRSEASE